MLVFPKIFIKSVVIIVDRFELFSVSSKEEITEENITYIIICDYTE